MNKEVLVEVKSTMTYDMYKKYFLFSLFKGKSYKRKMMMFYVMVFIGVAATLFSGITFGFDVMDITLLAIIVIMGVLISYLILFAPKSYYKTAKKILGNLTIFRFTSEYLEVESNAEAASGKSVIIYDSFHKIYEIDSDFYLYISNSQAYVVPKKDISEDRVEQLRRIFKSKLGKKYYNYCK